MSSRAVFYQRIVGDLIKDRNASVLVCGGGALDKSVFEALGFRNVTISNIDSSMKGDQYARLNWRFENAEALSLDAHAYDYVVAHAALHHASAPHRVLVEIYRVSKNGILAIESRDSFVMRVMERYGFTQVYEHAAVFHNDCTHGGVNNTGIPNYVYRWTEREVEKTIRSYAPDIEPRILYRYGTGFPCTPAVERNGRAKYLFLKAMQPLYWLFTKAFPRQQNLFAFYVEKAEGAERLFPWLTVDESQGAVMFDKEWGERQYGGRVGPEDQGAEPRAVGE